MSNKDHNTPELREMAFQTHLKEFEALRAELVQFELLEAQFLNYAIAIIAGAVALLAVSQDIVDNYPFIFLVPSILLSASGWAFVETNMHIHRLGIYIQNDLTPKVQKLIGEDVSSEYIVMEWEKTITRMSAKFVFFGFVWAGKILFILIPNIIFVVLFCNARSNQPEPWITIEILLYWVSIIMIAVFIVISLQNGFNNLMRSRKVKSADVRITVRGQKDSEDKIKSSQDSVDKT